MGRDCDTGVRSTVSQYIHCEIQRFNLTLLRVNWPLVTYKHDDVSNSDLFSSTQLINSAARNTLCQPYDP
jgi:hypothetical protein